MRYELSPRELTWAEADPARHPFDPAEFPRVLRGLGPAHRTPTAPDGNYLRRLETHWRDRADRWADAMSCALTGHYGRWVIGWRWGIGEGSFDGGPVGAWCCVSHSMATDPDRTLDIVIAAVLEWRDWLERLRGWFEAYPLDLDDLDDQRLLWDMTAGHLIRLVSDTTGCESGWQNHCRTVLGWFLEHHGVGPDRASELVTEAVGGRFSSWTAPDAGVVADVAERLSLAVGPADRARPTPTPVAADTDHLREWLAIRPTVPWPPAPQSLYQPEHDGAPEDALPREFQLFDAVIDPARAAGLQAALDLVTTAAAEGAELDFARLQSWQQHVLGTPEPPPFRTLPAFAKEGRERYGIAADTRERFDACLAESAAVDDLPVLARAARAFLDVCFFHPFDDGNARAAVLALAFVLAREGYAAAWAASLRRFSYEVSVQDAVFLMNRVGIGLAALTPAPGSAEG